MYNSTMGSWKCDMQIEGGKAPEEGKPLSCKQMVWLKRFPALININTNQRVPPNHWIQKQKRRKWKKKGGGFASETSGKGVGIKFSLAKWRRKMYNEVFKEI